MTYRIDTFLWCNQHDHDKVWGYATVQDEEVYVFWGKRGYTLAFQRLSGLARFTVMTKERKKLKSYTRVPISTVDEVWPGFVEFFETELFTAKMSDRFRHTVEE